MNSFDCLVWSLAGVLQTRYWSDFWSITKHRHQFAALVLEKRKLVWACMTAGEARKGLCGIYIICKALKNNWGWSFLCFFIHLLLLFPPLFNNVFFLTWILITCLIMKICESVYCRNIYKKIRGELGVVKLGSDFPSVWHTLKISRNSLNSSNAAINLLYSGD